MPYYIYKITEFPVRQLHKLEQHDAYRDASQRAKELRSQQTGDTKSIVKVIFAETELHAEDLLNQIRERAPELGDD